MRNDPERTGIHLLQIGLTFRMESIMKRLHYIRKNLWLILHLLLGTGRFGVNNQLWARQESIFSKKGFKKITSILTNYRMMKIRAFSGFIPLNDAIELFPGHAEKHGFKRIESNEKKEVGNE